MINPVGPSNPGYGMGQSGPTPDFQQLQQAISGLESSVPPIHDDQIQRLIGFSGAVITAVQGSNIPSAHVITASIEQLQNELNNIKDPDEKVDVFKNLCLLSLNTLNSLT